MFSSFSITHAAKETKADALQQLKVVLSISFLPLIVGFLAIIADSKEEKILVSIWSAFDAVFLNGELYFYAMSTCAYIFFLSSYVEKKGIRGVRLYSGVFVIFCTALMALYIGQGEDRNTIFHSIFSITLLASAVMVNYRVIVLSQQPPPMPEDVHRRDADDMADNLDTTYD